MKDEPDSLKLGIITLFVFALLVILGGIKNGMAYKNNNLDISDLGVSLVAHSSPKVVKKDEQGDGQIRESREASQKDKTEAIATFLQNTNSPLAVLAGDFVSVGDIYNLDPYLLVAISGVESSFGKHYPVATNNPFGIYSSSNSLRYFRSLSEALDYLGKLLSEKYDTTSVENIGRKYCPAHHESWSWKVRFFIEEIKKEEAKIEVL